MAKLLFVSSIFANHIFRLGVMEKALESSHKVAAAASFDGCESILQARGIGCFALSKIRRGGVNPWEDLQSLWELYRLYKAERPDVILHFTIKPNIYGSLAAGMANLKSIATVTGSGYSFNQTSLLPLLVRHLYKIAFRFPRVVCFQNPNDRDLFVEGRLVDRRKTRLTPGSGVNLGHFSPEGCLKNNRKDKKKVVFLFVGRLLWDKGIKEFAEAAGNMYHSFPQAEFWVLGRVDPGNPAAVPEEIFNAWVKEKKIHHLGYVQDVRPFLCDSDVVVLPSYWEGIPRSMLEAMAMAKPIITTDAVGCREVIEVGKNGFMVPVKNVPALTEAMNEMITIGERARREMGRYGREKAVKEFDERLTIQTYMKEIAQVLRH